MSQFYSWECQACKTWELYRQYAALHMHAPRTSRSSEYLVPSFLRLHRRTRCTSLFSIITASCIFQYILSSHFPTDFFHTNVYLLTHASSFVPSINTVSFDYSPNSSSRNTIWQNRFSQAFRQKARPETNDRAMVRCFLPCPNHMKLTSRLHAVSIFWEK